MLAKMVNLALLCLFPLAWQAPLAEATVAWFFTADRISIFSGVVDLYQKDLFLCVVVAFFAIVAPFLKTIALVYAQFSDSAQGRRMLPAIEVLARLSMTDVFLLAFYITAYQGVGDIEIQWGAYFFTALVLASIWASWETKRQLAARAGGDGDARASAGEA